MPLLVKMEVAFVVVLTLQLLASHGQAQIRRHCGSEVRISPSSQAVAVGSNATITCQHTNPSASVTFLWYYLPATLPDSEPYRSVFDDGVHYHVSQQLYMSTLLITNITLEDINNRYWCEKFNSPNCFTSSSDFTLFVKATITISTVQYIVNASESINITTVVTGNPLPTTIMVEKRDQLTGGYVDYPNTKYSVTGLSTISFTTLLPEDSGQYRACVENSHAAIGCSLFTITVKGLILIPPMATVKNGSSLSVTCRAVNFDDFEMTWQTARTSDDLANDPSVQVTQLSSTDLHLFVERVNKPARYSCVLRSSGSIIAEHFTVDIIDIPGPPRNLKIQKTGSNGDMYITWTAPETDNGSPLTAYYVNITVNGTISTIVRVAPSKTDLDYVAGKCKVINVTVTSENDCGNSSSIEFSIDTRNQCAAATSVGNSKSGDDDDDGSVWPAIGAGIAVVVVFVGLTLMAILVFVIWYRRQKRIMKHSSTLHDPESPSSVTVKSNKPAVTSSPPPFIKRSTSIRRYRNMLEVSKDSVTLRDVLQDGTYFELRKGLLLLSENDSKAHEVMVKKAKQSAPSEEEHNIQEEIKMMSTVGAHENVVGLLRTCLSEPPAYLITEYFAHGDLLGFLRASRGHYGMYTVSPGTGYKTQPCAVQGQDLLKMVRQVAAGMSYLAEKKITHRSLCARNVLVGTGLQVKVYNYGPKADSEATPPNYSKWMAPEMLFDGTANTMSDIWSFAVTSWEIITIGGSPFPTTHPEQMRDLLQSGHRLLKPTHCDEALYSLMEQCWDYDPTKRPTFTALHKQLDNMCKTKLSYLNSNLYNGDEYSQFEETDQLMTAL